jgi:hypothetical protein
MKEDMSELAFYVASRHRGKAVSTVEYSLEECLQLLGLRIQIEAKSSSDVAKLVERACFSKNVDAWKDFVQAHSGSVMKFSQTVFEEIRANHSRAIRETKEKSAVLMIQRAYRRHRTRKAATRELRESGFKYASGLIKLDAFSLSYTLLASDESTKFLLSLSSRTNET